MENAPFAGILNRIEGLFKRRRTANGGGESDDPLDILKDSHHDISRLAAQISSHAARAPYPGVAERLRRIAAEKQSSADLLRAKILTAHRTLDETALDLKSGG